MASPPQVPVTLETALLWARSGRESDKVYRFMFLHPDNFFTIPNSRKWSIAHQVVYNGDIDLFKRILVLFSEDEINIRTLSADKKTLLNVAAEQKTHYPDMYNYVEHLFLQDDLIQAAKKKDWPLVNDILGKYPQLTNEKPPYSTYFLLHYVIQNGDKHILEKLLGSFQFDTTIMSADMKTPLDIARKLKKDDICAILEPAKIEPSDSNLIEHTPPPVVSNENTSPSASSQLPYPLLDPFPSFDLHNTVLEVTEKGSYELAKKTFFTTTQIEVPLSEPTTAPDDKTQKIDNQNLKPNSEVPLPVTPITAASKSQLMKNFTCPLTQAIFIDPVIASDGQTYEREAIAEYVSTHHSSPMTGVAMNAIFKDNTEVKQIIKLIRQQN